MTCREYEPLIALYGGGDPVDGEVERHLAVCANCRELLEDLRESRAMLKELASEAVDAEFLSEVRARVLARTERGRLWLSMAASAAGLALLAGLPAPRRAGPVPAVAVKQAGPPRDGRGSVWATAPQQAAPLPQRRAAARARKRAHPRAGGELVVKMFTDDPNIVVIWLVDQPGD